MRVIWLLLNQLNIFFHGMFCMLQRWKWIKSCSQMHHFYSLLSSWHWLLCVVQIRYLRSTPSRQSSEHTVSELVELLNAIDSWARKYKFPSDKDLKHINRKLKSCWGLSSHDESKKWDKKSKHKSKRSSNEMQPVPSHTEISLP
ncbi:cyclin-H1-1-like isoform X1 [Prunus dulcis]|uniref:cyclin-H1-1-like isoform X1 n=1 Tax=Prunus dulcis TaxID=3755 RepID=UPI001483B1E3|nr:cyclin-H1-1-like isoform X1 [Prunus dulcis]XP_034202964.1 cyclin-H1-1-like isoform X1 [Prunus dulcis]